MTLEDINGDVIRQEIETSLDGRDPTVIEILRLGGITEANEQTTHDLFNKPEEAGLEVIAQLREYVEKWKNENDDAKRIKIAKKFVTVARPWLSLK